MKTMLLTCAALLAAVPATAQQAGAPSAPIVRTVVATPKTILFIGNSFTQGAHSATRNWHANAVTDLNGDGYGGVPALFKAFADQTGQNYTVSLETQGGKTLGFHYDERRQLFDKPWDVVVLQELSTLSRTRPGDSTDYVRDVGRLTGFVRRRNPAVRVYLNSTWTRADEVYRNKGPWSGRPVADMAIDLRRAADRTRAATPGVTGILPVGEAWNRAMTAQVADPDPYDGTTFGQVDLWTYDHYHASVAGYYLEALIVFGRVTGIDPRVLGRDEKAADELGLDPSLTQSLQRVAWEQLKE